jgi:ABC-type transport system substrate-binding protein
MTLQKILNLTKRFFLLITIIAFTAMTITACNPIQLKTNAAQVPQLVRSILNDPKTFNAALGSESPNIFDLTYEGLLTQNPINGKIEGALAQSWQISPDKTKITFTMREGLKWSDGEPLTVDDVVFTYNDIYLNEKIPTDTRDVLRIGKDRKLPTVKKIDNKRVEFSVPEPFRPFLLNTVDPIKSQWFNNVQFRQAVAYAIDRQTMLNNTFRGLGTFQNSSISVLSPYFLSPEKGLKVYKYNPDKAKELLIKAGFKYNDKNLLVDNQGNEVRFSLLTNAGNKIRESMGSQIKQDLSKIGIQVDFTPLAWNTFIGKISNTLDWEAGLLGLIDGLEPNDGANVWSPDGGLHMFNQKPQAGQKPIEGREVAPWEVKINELYIQGAQEFDEVKVKEIYWESQQLTQEYLPFIYLVNSSAMSAIRNRFKGIQFSVLGGAFWNIHEIKVTK